LIGYVGRRPQYIFAKPLREVEETGNPISHAGAKSWKKLEATIKVSSGPALDVMVMALERLSPGLEERSVGNAHSLLTAWRPSGKTFQAVTESTKGRPVTAARGRATALDKFVYRLQYPRRDQAHRVVGHPRQPEVAWLKRVIQDS